MKKTKPAGIYRTIVLDAWRLGWQRKSLWVFGIFAGFISPGIFDVISGALTRIRQGATLFEQLMNESFVGYTLVSEYIQQLLLVGSLKTALLLIAFILVTLLLITIAVLSQIALVVGIASREHLHNIHLRERAWHLFPSVLILDGLTKGALALGILLSILPLWLFYLETSTYHLGLMLVELIFFLTALFLIQTVSMLTLIHLVQHGTSVWHAIHASIKILSRHWLSNIEFALVLFFCSSLMQLVAIGLMIVLVIPYRLVYSATLLVGSTTLPVSVTLFFAACSVLLFLLTSGFATTFQYRAWFAWYERASHRVHGKQLMTKMMRMLKARYVG